MRGFGHHATARWPLYDEGAGEWCIGASEDFKITVERVVRGAQVEQQDLILTVMDDVGDTGAERGEFEGSEVAEKNAVLRVIAFALKQVEQLGPAFVVGDVVGDEVMASGHGVG